MRVGSLFSTAKPSSLPTFSEIKFNRLGVLSQGWGFPEELSLEVICLLSA